MRALILASIVLASAACAKSNNLLLGRVETQVAGHTVVVTDCYRTSVPEPRFDAGTNSQRWTPCRDADVSIGGQALIVNGTTYGPLAAGDAVTVDHGRVLVNHKPAVQTR
jgi:hypothetical protein